MATSTLTKWGNSQGLIIPKALCRQLGIDLGDEVSLEVNSGKLTTRPTRAKFQRARKVSIEELFADWEGTYEVPADWPSVGNEIDWGEAVGSEAW